LIGALVDGQPLLYNLVESQRQLGGLSRSKLYEHIAVGDIQTVKIGRRTFIARAELEAFVARHSQMVSV
jgi:predicted DNA-binding transcriptional regulator AlpA